jgi:hypothetical protein
MMFGGHLNHVVDKAQQMPHLKLLDRGGFAPIHSTVHEQHRICTANDSRNLVTRIQFLQSMQNRETCVFGQREIQPRTLTALRGG